MKIAVNILKFPNDFFEAEVVILDSEDFPTECIFDTRVDYPSVATYKLERKNVQSVLSTFTSYNEAKKWALQQVESLKLLLATYRMTTRDAPIFFEI